LTDTKVPKRLGPKRATKIRKLFALKKEDDVRRFVIRRKIEKEGKPVRTKAPKIQRLITDERLRRKRVYKVIIIFKGFLTIFFRLTRRLDGKEPERLLKNTKRLLKNTERRRLLPTKKKLPTRKNKVTLELLLVKLKPSPLRLLLPLRPPNLLARLPLKERLPNPLAKPPLKERPPPLPLNKRPSNPRPERNR